MNWPVPGWLRDYRADWFRLDVVAGLTAAGSFDAATLATLFPGDPGYVPPAPSTLPSAPPSSSLPF